jgi:hypothetical protein
MNTPHFTHLAAALVAEHDEPPVDVERLAVLVAVSVPDERMS